MNYKEIVIIDYGMGNLWSVISAFKYLGTKPIISSDPDVISSADALVLPGVGSFRKAMEVLEKSCLDQAIIEAVKVRGSNILGICLGMQLLGSRGTEDGYTNGLNLVSNVVEQFTKKELKSNKLPHIGFNSVSFSERKGLFSGLPAKSDFYFVHSYRMPVCQINGRTATCHYGSPFLAGFEIENICGTQFHPEKSQSNGLLLLENFLKK